MAQEANGKFWTRRTFLQTSGAMAAAVSAPFAVKTSAFAVEGKISIMNTIPTLANEYWQGWDAGARAACQQLGLKYVIQTFEDFPEKQLSQIEQAPSMGVNGVIAFAQNAEIIKAMAVTAKQHNVLVADVHSTAAWLDPVDPVFQGAYAVYTQPDNVRSMQKVCEILFEKMGGEGDVIFVCGFPGNFSTECRRAGAYNALAKYPKIRKVAEQNGGENRVAARPVFENLLTANPNIRGVMCHNDDTAIAVTDVLRERDLTGKIFVVGIDAINEFLTRMQTNPSALATVSIDAPFHSGLMAVELYDRLSGVSFAPLELMRYTDTLVIDTPAAAAAYVKLMDPAKPLPYDFKAMSRHLAGDGWITPWRQEIIDPRKLWSDIPAMEKLKPANWTLPDIITSSLKNGDLERLNAMYRDHYKSDPLQPIVQLTTTKTTVLAG